MFKKKEDLSNGWWNYRFVIRTTYNDKDKTVSSYYEMMEVYYDKNGNILAWCDEPAQVYTESYKDLKTFIRQIKDASKRSVLKLENDTIIDTNLYMSKMDIDNIVK